jgi:iron complex transport system substrate-binding protein
MTKLRILLVVIVASAAAALVLRRGSQQPSPQSSGKLRIVSLAPSVTEILYALNLGDNIVGVTDQCNYPPAARKIERVSGFGTPNVEKLLALGPTVVIACGLEKPEFSQVLRQAGIQVVDVQKTGFIASFPELFDAVIEIGEATGRSTEAQKLIAGMQAELDAVARQIGRIDDAQCPRVFVEIEESPLMTAGAGSFIDDLIRRAGGRNVASELANAYPRIDPEKVIAWDPEVILVAHSDHAGEAGERLARRIGWSNVSAVRDRRVIDDIDADLLFRPGPRLIEGVKALAARLHPAQLPFPACRVRQDGREAGSERPE